ncbi:hypothetical protein OS493_040530, partial [Desmophyllum pertusum]
MAKYCLNCKPGVTNCVDPGKRVWEDCPEGQQCALYFLHHEGSNHIYDLACEGKYGVQEWVNYCKSYGSGRNQDCNYEFF